MVTARARKKLPVTPETDISGRKTTIGVMVEPISGVVISLRALRIAPTLPPETGFLAIFRESPTKDRLAFLTAISPQP